MRLNQKRAARSNRQQFSPSSLVPRPNWGLAEGTVRSSGQVIQRRISWPSASVAAASYGSYDTSLLASANEYSSLSAVYQKYRFVSIRAYFFTAATGASNYYLVCTFRGATLSSSVTSMWGAERPKLFEPENTSKTPPMYETRAVSLNDSQWTPIGTAPTSNQETYWGIKFYNGGSTGSTVFYEALIELQSNT